MSSQIAAKLSLGEYADAVRRHLSGFEPWIEQTHDDAGRARLNGTVREGDPVNKVVHFEIPFHDQDRAKEFYGSIFDWEPNTMDRAAGRLNAVSIDDTLKKIRSSGGATVMPRTRSAAGQRSLRCGIMVPLMGGSRCDGS